LKNLYPLYLKLEAQPVLVIGGGPVAHRRVHRLLECDARVTVVSPDVVPEIESLHRERRLVWTARRFHPDDLAAARLAFLAVGDPALVEVVRREARRRGVFLNTAEEESSCDFHVPAVSDHKGVKLAISTAGASPTLAAALRQQMDVWLSSVGDETLEELRRNRKAGRQHHRRDREERSTGKKGAVKDAMVKKGTVYLVGAGPGDPGLLTMRAWQLLQQAEIVYYDRLIGEEILATIPEMTERVYVGKDLGDANRANIAALMIQAARAGRTVVRLKGGDPILFGRGGEEMLELGQANVDFEIVPGVSALCAVPGAAGIPVTYRGIASELVVRSGHRMAEASGPEGELTRTRNETTFVYFMAVGKIPDVVRELAAEGLSPSTPVAIVEKGTLPEEKVVIGELKNIARKARDEAVEPPALIIAGDVVAFRQPSEFLALLRSTGAIRSSVRSAIDARTV